MWGMNHRSTPSAFHTHMRINTEHYGSLQLLHSSLCCALSSCNSVQVTSATRQHGQSNDMKKSLMVKAGFFFKEKVCSSWIVVVVVVKMMGFFYVSS